VPLHVTTYAEGAQHEAALRLARIETQTTPTKQGRATQVTITVLIPNDGTRDGAGETFRTRSVVSTRPGGSGTVLATASGRSGTVMTLRFTLDVA
jgi:hypothetical protein